MALVRGCLGIGRPGLVKALKARRPGPADGLDARRGAQGEDIHHCSAPPYRGISSGLVLLVESGWKPKL